MDHGTWNSDTMVSFSVAIIDTMSLYDLYLDVRNDPGYPFCNLFLFLHSEFPDGRVTSDTIECLLASPDGKWLGSGIGSIRTSRFLFQKGIRFRDPGTYRFVFEQAMRVHDLQGIRDFGIRIDKIPSH